MILALLLWSWGVITNHQFFVYGFLWGVYFGICALLHLLVEVAKNK